MATASKPVMLVVWTLAISLSCVILAAADWAVGQLTTTAAAHNIFRVIGVMSILLTGSRTAGFRITRDVPYNHRKESP